MPGWLKAGLIGAGILVVLSLLGLIPFLGCITLPLTWVTYAVVGVLAARYTAPPRTAGAGAGQGALAGVLAALVGGLVGLVIGVIQGASGGAAALANMPPEVLEQMRDAGVPLEFFASIGGAAVISTICCTFGMLIAAVLGALGGGIYAASKQS